MPVSRQQFDEIRRRVAETAPPGLSKTEFDALVFAEADKLDPAPEMRAASSFDETGGQKAIRLAKEWGPMAAATAATLPLGGVAGWGGLAARMAAAGGAAGVTKLATGSTPSEAATTGALYTLPEVAGGTLRALAPIGKRLYGFATKGTETILKDTPAFKRTGDLVAARKQIQDTLREAGFPLPTVKGLKKIQDAIGARVAEVTRKVKMATGSVPDISRQEVVKSGIPQAVKRQIQENAPAVPSLKEVATTTRGFLRESPKALTPLQALSQMRGLNRGIALGSPFETTAAQKAAKEGIAKGYRRALTHRVPSIQPLNEQISRLIPAERAMMHGAGLDITRAPASIPEFVSFSGMRPGTFFVAGLNRPIVSASVGKGAMKFSEWSRKVRAEHLLRLLLAQAEGGVQ